MLTILCFGDDSYILFFLKYEIYFRLQYFLLTSYVLDTISNNGSGKRVDDNVGDFFFGDAEMDPLSLDFEINGLDGLITQDWTLPTEAFPLRHEIQDQSPPPEQLPNNDSPEPPEGNDVKEIAKLFSC